MRLSPRDASVARQLAARLLAYPDAELFGELPLLERATTVLPPAERGPLSRFLTYLRGTPADRLESEYVQTFDQRKRCCLYLTYYAYGDTRKRGMALLRFNHAYRAAGRELTESELPDFLPVVLEFAATVDPVTGERLLREHRAGLELLRLALSDAGSPYAGVLEAVCHTLPEASPKDREAALRLAEQGPPAEEVGLEPFAPPEYMGGVRP